MGIFATTNEVKRLRAIVEILLDDVAELKRARRSLDLEFTELYDKVSHQMSRMSKRDAHRKKADVQETLDLPDGNDENGVDPISQSILLRRSRMGGTK